MEWNHFVSKILALSKTGLKFSKDPYALENYAELRDLAMNQIHETSQVPEGFVLYPKDAYPTPNVSVRIVIFNEQGQLLMVQEAQDGKYCIPGGWCDVYESARENAVKEVHQETGLHVEIDRLLAVFQRDLYKEIPTMVSEYVLYFSAKVTGGELQSNHEILSVAYYDLNDLPILSRKTSPGELHKALEVYQKQLDVYFD